MAKPKITFFCEAEESELREIFNESTFSMLKEMDASISLGILDMSSERAAVVSKLNEADIPVTAWLLMPREQGYWLNSSNSHQAKSRYLEFRAWTEKNNLKWRTIGLDFEPDIQELEQLANDRKGWFRKAFQRILDGKKLQAAKSNYAGLIKKIHNDGYTVETYQFPILVDERRVRSSFLQRAIGIVDIKADKEVMMLYTSLFRPHGAGIISSYAQEADAIAVGCTGGGVELELIDRPPVDWDELERDLRLVWYWKEDIYIFSLEGCIQQDFLKKIAEFEWDFPVILPDEQTKRVNGWRSTFRSVLWVVAHPGYVIAALVSIYLVYRTGSRIFKS